MPFADAEIIHTGSHKWVLFIGGRDPETYSTKSAAQFRLRWLRKWKTEQTAS